MKKFKKGTKIKLMLVGGVIAIIAVILIGLFMQYKQREYIKQTNPELARAMTYPVIADKEKEAVVEGTNNCVQFDAFFLRDINGDGYTESIRGTSKEIGKEDTLYMELNIQTAGALKNGKITVNGENFYLQTSLPKDKVIKDNYIGNNIKTIEFNDIANGTQKMLTGIVRSGDYSYSSRKAEALENNINNYSKVNSVTLTGTYVPEEGEPVEVTKTVNFNIDWYGETKATISNTSTNYRDLDDRIDEENGTISLDFSIRTNETKNELILKDNHVEAQIPQLNGYDPISVEYTGSNATSNYNAQTRTLTIDREAKVEEDGTVTTGLSNSNSYNIKVIYPLEAYQSVGGDTVQVKIPVSTYYEGYNNSNEEFENPYKSNIASTTLTATYKHVEIVEEPEEPVEPSKPPVYPANFSVTIGKYTTSPTSRYVVSKLKPLKIYNGVSEDEQDDTYQVEWYAYTGTNGATNGLVLKETKNGEEQKVDNFIKTNSNKESTEDVTTNIGIAFSGASDVLKDDGWIKVYDEDTGNLLVTFTKDNWNKYTYSNPYKYDLPVKHIRVETSETNADARLYVYNIKKLDDEYITTNYTKEEFDNLQYIETNLAVYLGGNLIGTKTHKANYEVPYSVADIGISKNTISTQITEKNEKITITARYNSLANQAGWVDGSFIVKLPEGILTAKINSVQINNNDVSITSYEVVEQDGVNLIKINTENKNDTPQTYSITVDVDITPNPMAATTKGNIELYASNGEICDYYYKASDIYDVNNNLNTEEQVNHDTTSFSMISPSSLLTNQIGSNYDDKGSTIVSPQVAEVRPAYGVVDKEHEKEATIGVQVTNNYGNRISEIQILGKIPFKGNTYVLSGGDLGSTFTTRMIEAGITVPEKLQQYVTVYYSENENPDRDLSKSENGWKTADEITNWDNIKTYLIDFGDYVMPTGENYSFNYTVKIPNGVEFNQEAYSHHGVYYSLETEQGKYRTQVEPNKLGFRIAEKYNLELTKYQTGKEKVIPGATYSITDEASGEIKTAVTNTDGTLTIKNLYAEKAYLIKEIKTPSDYELNSDVIRFIGHVDENGNLTIEKTQGNTREDMQVIKNEGEDYKAIVKVEDEAKASIKIHKTEQGTSTPIQTVKYKLTGYGLPENGRFVITNTNGEVTINGLSVNQEYTLQELKAEGYYLADPITFKIINNNGNYSIQTTAGTISGQSTDEKDSIPTVTINLEDEKIPRYSLQIIKVKKTLDTTLTENEEEAKDETPQETPELTYLAGAKFKLYKGTKEIGEYITDETGTITIDDLYQYIEGKVEDAAYTLKEVLAPEGYVKVKDITFKVDGTDGSLKLINSDGTEEKYTVEGNTVKLTIEDSPSFKLIKKDAETGNTLANIKFAIYNVENGEVPATNSKGETIGTKETINGKEYYTVQTNEKGELTADLPEGLYKAVEVEAPEKYDIEDNVYYFGIGASREAKEGLVTLWAKSFGGNISEEIQSVASTSDGGYIVGGYFSSSSIQVGEETLTNNGDSDGLIIKYDAKGEVEWAKSFGGRYDEYIQSVASTSDGGYIAGGYFESKSIQVGEETLTNNSSSGRYTDGLIIKYDAEGEVEWANSFGGSGLDYIQSVAETSDGGYIAGGYFQSSSIKVGEETLTNNSSSTSYTDGLIIKYDAEGEVEWAKSIGGSGSEEIQSVASTSDGGYIAGGCFSSSSIQVGEETLTKNGYYDGLIIKYDADGTVEWAKSIGGSRSEEIKSVASTSDGGYIAGGYFSLSNIQVGEETLINRGSLDGLIIKYDAEGEVEWAKSIGGRDDECIQSVAETSDGGYIAGGYFSSSSIQVGEETLTNNSSSTSYTDGLIIKYDAEGEVELAKSFGGDESDPITSVVETNDGRILAGGYFQSSSIKVGEETLTKNGYYDGLIIKLEVQEIPNPVVTNAKSIGGSRDEEIQSVASTSDGGILAGGYFKSSTIQVGEETLTNSGSEYYSDALIIKYSNSGEVEWARSIGGRDDECIQSVAETSDGGYIAGGYFSSSSIQVGEETLTNNGDSDGLIIKYDADGTVEWANSFGGSGLDYIQSVAETSDGGYIAGGYFKSSTIQVGEETLTNNGYRDGLIIKYDAEGEVEWARSVGGDEDDYIVSVAETSDGGYIAGGYFESKSIQVGEETLINRGSLDGLIIKYDADGTVEWAKSFGGDDYDYIRTVASTSDGGILAGGYFKSSSIQVGEETLTNSGSSGYSDGLIIKYDAEGEVEWAKSIGGSRDEEIQSVASTSDGGYVAVGNFESSIQVGEETLINSGFLDGLIIKYDAEGEVEWAKSIGGSRYEEIQSVAETNNGRALVGGYFNSSTIEVDGHTITNNSSSTSYSDGMILEIVNQVGAPEVQELTVENSRKEFKITTDVSEIDGIKGGSISGEDMSAYEKVKYGDSSTKDIVMTPDENYEIIEIIVNGEEWSFEENEDGTYKMSQFTNVTEDKHIEVTYALKDNKLTINKVDSKTKEPLPGATFKIDQLEERTEPENAIGKIVANGEEYTELDTEKGEVTEVLGSLTNNGTYYFVENTDGTLTPTNSKTYQTANGGTTGIKSSTANSYVEIDLSNLEGKYVVVVNAKISSESRDYGYATVTETTTAPSYSASTGRFFRISGTSTSVTTPKDYESEILEGGKTYYLHLGYYKDSSLDKGDDQLVVNSIKVYGTNSLTYNFVENSEGGYESNNQGQDNTTANSYIPIDLTELTGKYNLTVNAKISSQSSDYGYATITTNTERVAYNTNTTDKVRFVYISGEKDSEDYTTVLQGGQMYYLHLGYYKNASTSSEEDKFKVNSIKVTLNDSELYHTEVTTNSQGQGIVQIPFGKYQITEVVAPDGYELNEQPTVIEFRADGDNHEIAIENQESAKVIVHHFLKNNDGEYTTEKVAEDELLEGKIGEDYTTTPKLDLEKYELEKDEKGEYIIPTNTTGEFTEKTIEVKYYYEAKKIPLTVHHYIEGTITSVPLKNGGIAEDVTESGEEGEKYTTSPIKDSLLSDDYELLERPTNATGTYASPEVVVTYYYKRVSRPVVINKFAEDGKTPLQGATFNILSKEDANKIGQIAEVGAITPSGDYYFIESDGKLINNNQGKDNKTANSYIKIDLTGKPDATLKINAEISSENIDYGYAIVNQSTSNPSYSTTSGRIFRISGQVDAKDYETTLTGGNVYYLHLGYRKDGSISKYDDTFTINSIKLNDINIIDLSLEATTNSKGQITTNLESGDYVATEVSTPEGYQLPANPKTEFSVTKEDDVVTLNITNEKAKGTVITHYYIEGTTNKVPLQNGGVAEDVKYTGNVGDIYATKEAENVSIKYELLRIEGETSGTIENGTKEVIYYYRLKNRDLTIVKTNEQGEGLEGAEFKIENKENGKINYATTGAEGKVTVQVPVGESIVTETKAPIGYKLNRKPVNITIELDKENAVTIKNKAINYYTLELSKIDSETKELISGVEFSLTYSDQYGQNHDNTYTTDLNGKITLENLEDEIVYTLKETKTPKGYIKDTEEKQFVVHYVDGAYQIEQLEGSFNDLVINGETIKVNIENEPSLKIVKQDNHGQPIQGVKFTITDEQGQDVTDGFGNKVGTIENIDGKMLRVLTTDENGVITENLVPGKYVITEVQAPWQYGLPEDENERKQTIEITSEGFEGTYVEQAGVTQINTNNLQELIQYMGQSGSFAIVNAEIIAEGKIALELELTKDVTIPGKYTVSGQDINLKFVGSSANAVNMILTQDGKVEKVVLIKVDENSNNATTNTLSMINGDYITLGMYMGTIRIPAEDTVNNQELTLSTTGSDIGEFIARYNSEGKIESLKDISYLGIDLSSDYFNIYLKDLNGKIEIFYPYEGETITIPGSETSQGKEITVNSQTGGLVVILDDELKVTNALANPMGGYVGRPPQFEILSTGGMLQGTQNTEEGGLVIPGEQTVSGEQITLNNYGDGILAKATPEGKIEWVKPLGAQAGLYLNVTEVSDGYLTIAYYLGNLVIPAEETENGEEIRVENSADTIKFSLIKYTTDGKVEWVTDAGIDMNDLDYIENVQIRESKDGYAIIIDNGKVVSFERKYSDPIVKEQEVVTIQNTISKGSLVVHYYKEGTTESISNDVTSIGDIGTPYETHEANDIPANYELVETPSNANGNYAEGETTVTYYYRLKTPTLTNQTITKTGTSMIESLNQPITYNIKYTAELRDYTGDVTVKLVDTLPYPLDTTKTNIEENLAGGTYDEATNTITWEEKINDVKATETKEIEVEKTITVVYKDVDKDVLLIDNKVATHLEYSTNQEPSQDITANWTTTTGFVVNIPVSKIWEDDGDKLGQRPTKVRFKLTGSDGSEYFLDLAKPGTETGTESKSEENTTTQNSEQDSNKSELITDNESNEPESTTTQDSDNPNKWNDMFVGLPKYDKDNKEIVYTLSEEASEDLKYYDTSIDNESNTITNSNKYGKVTVHYYIIDNEGKKTTNRVPDEDGKEIPDIIIEGKEGDKYETEPAKEVSEKYELVQTELPENADGKIEKYNPEKEQVVIYYYRLKPAKVIINYLEKDGDNDDRNNQILSPHEEIDGYVDDKYDTDEKHKKETITKDGKKYTLVEDSKNTEGKMTVEDTEVTYYYLQNTKATVRYVERDPVTHEIIKDLEEPFTQEGLVGDEFETKEKAFMGYKLVEAPKDKTIQMTKEEQVLIYYYEPVYTGLVENHIDITNNKLLYTETHDVQVGDDYNISSKEFAGYDLVEEKLPENAEGTMEEELVTVNYYYIKKVVLEVNYIDQLTGEPLADQIVDKTKHEGDKYETEQKDFDGYDFIKVEGEPEGTMQVEVDEDGNIVNNKTVVTYYYAKRAQIEEHHVDIRTGKELEEPIVHNGHVGDKYNIPSKEFLSYEVLEKTEDGKNMLPENAKGEMTEEKQIITYYYYQPAKVIVHYIDKTTEKELEETDPESGEVVSSRVTIDGQIEDEYKTEAKEFPYYALITKELPENSKGKMKVEITKDKDGKTKVNNIIDVYYYYEPKPFNIGVDKIITKITVNGEEQNISNNKLTRVEIYRKNVNDTKVEVEYTIKVTNNEEVDGKAIIRENIPDGMSVVNNDGTWDEKDGYLEKVIPEIKAGETKEYKITLAWDGGDANLGEKDNKVEITQTDNVPGFKDGNSEDNSSEATVMINISTGSVPWPLIVALVAVAGLEGITLAYANVLTKRNRKQRK